MEMLWIGAAVIGGLSLGACYPRRSEREALRPYPRETKLRIYVPLFPWRDRIAPSDHGEIAPLRLRTNIAIPILLTLPIIMTWIPSDAHESLESKPQVVQTTSAEPATPAKTIAPQPHTAQKAPIDSEPTPTLSSEALAELRSPTRLYGTAKVKPMYRLHDVEGARITQIDPDSFWAILGVREGDVVIELHGEPVDNPATLVALMNAMERDEHVELAVRGTDGEIRYLEFRNRDD